MEAFLHPVFEGAFLQLLVLKKVKKGISSISQEKIMKFSNYVFSSLVIFYKKERYLLFLF